MILPFSDEQARVLVNLRQQYEVSVEAEQALAAMPYNLLRKEVNGYTSSPKQCHIIHWTIHSKLGCRVNLRQYSISGDRVSYEYRIALHLT